MSRNLPDKISTDINATLTELGTMMHGFQTDPFGSIHRLSNQLTNTLRSILTDVEQTNRLMKYGFVAMTSAILLSLFLYYMNSSPLIRVIIWTIYAGLCLHILMTFLRYAHRRISPNSEPQGIKERNRILVNDFFVDFNSLERRIIQSKTPTDIQFFGEKLDQNAMKIIVTHAIQQQKCRNLELISTELTSNEISILSDGLINNQTLKSLSLWKNSIGDEGVQFLSIALSSNETVLTKLDLSSNGITDLGAEYLSHMLRFNRTLIDLSLSNNRITDLGFQLLIQSLKDQNRTIQLFSIAQNEFITDKSVETLIDLFKSNRSLRKFWLNNCHLTKKGREQLRRSKSKEFDLYT